MSAARRAVVCSVAYAVLTVVGCGGARPAGGAPPVSAPPAPQASASASPAGQTLHWSGRLAAGRTVEVHTVLGSVRAVAATDDVAVIDATMAPEAESADPADRRASLRIREDDSGVTLGTEHHGSHEGGCECDEHGTHGHLPRVDVVVRVPAGLHLVVHTVDARIDVDGLKGPVDLHSVDGPIDLRAMTSAQARTVNGAIHVAFALPDLADDSALSTVNGAVDVTLPASANADLSVSTVNGHVRVDPPPAGPIEGRGLRMALGHGGRSLRLRTVNGTISVKRG